MIKLENTDVFGWEAAIRGMRNPMNSWDKSDSDFSCSECIAGDDSCYYYGDVNHIEDDVYDHNWCNHTKLCIGNADLKLMQNLAKAGSDHAKYLRMINVSMDITAPLYWWKEFDTYKVGTVANSCSTMHKIADKEFKMEDFSCEHLGMLSKRCLEDTIIMLNRHRTGYLEHKDIIGSEKAKEKMKFHWWQMIQLLPSSYNQRRTVQMNYQVLWNMYNARKNHKLHEWHTFCDWIEGLPYFCSIFGVDKND